jgi:hypothetical protein
MVEHLMQVLQEIFVLVEEVAVRVLLAVQEFLHQQEMVVLEY